MKNTFTKSLALVAATLVFVSCSNDNDSVNDISGTGTLGVEFDNAYGANDLILNTQENTTFNNEVLKISGIKYIISNIVLTKEDGTTYTYPKSQGYFIVDEANEDTHVIELPNVPAGNYTKVKFGVGVDQPQYELGEDAQGDFVVQAQAAGLLSDWSQGYSLLTFSGTFTSPTVTSATPFAVNAPQIETAYNYIEIMLDLPTKALVRTTISPEIHIIADLSKIIDGTNKIKLSDNISGANGAVIAQGSVILGNLSDMFTVNHVHNESSTANED